MMCTIFVQKRKKTRINLALKKQIKKKGKKKNLDKIAEDGFDPSTSGL